MADIKKITLPDGSQYDIKDDNALPKTAGSLNPVTGDLYLTSDPTVGRTIYITDGADPQAVVQYNADGSGQIGETEADGTLKSGIYIASTGALRLASNEHGIYLRPNGWNVATGQVYFDTDGQQHGGHLVTSTDDATSKTISTSFTQLSEITVSAGVYIVKGWCNFKGLGTSSTAYGMIAIGHGSSATSGRSTTGLNCGTSSYMSCNSVYIQEVTASSYTIGLYAMASTSTTSNAYGLRYVQIA